LIERILDERKSMFPYTDQQAQRFMQVYRDLKSKPIPVKKQTNKQTSKFLFFIFSNY
jgi:hypothetical protein